MSAVAAAVAAAPGSAPAAAAPAPAAAVPAAVPGVVDPAAAAAATIDTKWLGDAAAPELVGYVQNKGWKGPMDVLDGYRNLEKLVGEKRLAMPKGESDTEGWNRLYGELGRPKEAKEYKLPVPEGVDGKLAETMSMVFHKAGLSTRQAQSIATEWNAMQTAAMKEAEQAKATAQAEAVGKLRTEWGSAFDERMGVIDRAERTFIGDEKLAQAMIDAVGITAFSEIMYRIGNAIGEHKGGAGLEGQQPGAGGALTPQQAQAEIARLKADSVWSKAYVNGDAEKKSRMQQLMAWAYPG